jgi:hypothetical protein
VSTPAQVPFDAVTGAVKRATSLNDATLRVARRLAVALSAPIAVLSHGTDGWRFEAEGFPKRSISDATPCWAVVPVGRVVGRDWMLMLPGEADHWSGVPGLDTFVSQLCDVLARVALREGARR